MIKFQNEKGETQEVNHPNLLPENVKFPVEVFIEASYEFHLRYQPVGPGKEYTDISFGGDTRAKLHCEPNKNIHHPIFAYAD